MNKFLRRLILFFLISSITAVSYSQKKEFVSIDRYIKKSNISLINTSGFIDLTSYLPDNYVVDGSIDYTHFIQKGLNENQRVIMPNFPVLINEKGLIINSNKEVFFKEYSIIILNANSKERYHLLDLKNSNNVIIYNPKLVGDRDFHVGNRGEWGMGINLHSSTNIKIFNPEISKCWGDGIYIGGSSGIPSSNILIDGGSINECRRNGISITNGEKINIKSVVLANTYGTPPMCGIDMEPNSNSNVLRNINLESIVTINNADVGLAINLSNLKEIDSNKVSIVINKHRDIGSKIGIGIGGVGGNTLYTKRGVLNIKDCNFDGSRPFEIWSKNNNGIEVYISNPKGEEGKLKKLQNQLKVKNNGLTWR